MSSMTAAVEIVSSSPRVREAVGAIQSVRYVASPSKNVAAPLIVAIIADLFEGKRRRELGQFVAKYHGELPVVLFQPKAISVVGEGFQAFVRWSRELEQEPYVASDTEVVRRIVLAKQSKAEQRLIASASIENGNLVMWTCEPKRYEVPIAQIPALTAMKPESLSKFQVSISGSRIHWDDGDVDLNAESIRAMADPQVRQQQETLRRQEAARYAKAIRGLREERGLRQADIEGLTSRQVRRLEDGETIPHSATLKKLATAHGMTVDVYLRELARRCSKAKIMRGKTVVARRSLARGKAALKKRA